nr:MAG TPA: hypothetical protein [Caudoviricetes sp.]
MPICLPAPASRKAMAEISASVVAKLFNFVIAMAFYPSLLMVSHKFGVHFHLSMSDKVLTTRGSIFALLTLNFYALRWQMMFLLTSVLAWSYYDFSLHRFWLVLYATNFLVAGQHILPRSTIDEPRLLNLL